VTEATGGILSGLGDILSGLLGEGSIGQQFLVWGVLQQVMGALNGPFIQALTNDLNAKNPENPLSPADLADMVIRSIMAQADAEAQAAKSGVSAADFDLMVQNTGEPPAIEQMLQLWRRGKASDADVTRAIQQSRIRPEWIPFVEQLGVQPPTPADILRAVLTGQTDQTTGQQMYVQLGGDPDYYQLLLDTEGSAPTPEEAADMARRGIIPWDGEGPDVTSFHQAFLEGPWRDKWEPAFKAAANYLPPPRTVVTLIHQGVITDAQALQYLEASGVDSTLAAAYIAEGHATKSATEKTLASSTITQLYEEGAITRDQADKLLQANNYSSDNANFLLDIADTRQAQRFLNIAISKVHSLYISFKLDKVDAQSALRSLQIPQSQVDNLFILWDVEREGNVKHLTPAQIARGYKYNILTQDEAQSLLGEEGYRPHDAWTYLSIVIGAPLPNEPAPDNPATYI